MRAVGKRAFHAFRKQMKVLAFGLGINLCNIERVEHIEHLSDMNTARARCWETNHLEIAVVGPNTSPIDGFVVFKVR